MPRQTRSQAKNLGGQRAENPIEPRTARQPRTRGDQPRAVKAPGISVTKRRANKQAKRRSAKAAVGVTQRRRATFNSLPTEIRLMIWKEFVLTPRIIHIDILDNDLGKKRGFEIKINYTRHEQVCPLLGVNYESRSVALEAPLIMFGIHYPVTGPKRFAQKRLYRHFAIRRHDIVFFENSHASAFDFVSGSEGSNRVSNIMIDLDADSVDYKSWCAQPSWALMFEDALRLTRGLSNRKKLENFYCLMRRSNTAKHHRRFGPDDLRPLATSSFRGKNGDIRRWLAEFQGFLGDSPRASMLIGDYEGYSPTLKSLWRNVTVKR